MFSCVQSHICYLSTQQLPVTTSMLWAILQLPLHLWKEVLIFLLSSPEQDLIYSATCRGSHSSTAPGTSEPHCAGKAAHGIPSPTPPKPQHCGDFCYPASKWQTKWQPPLLDTVSVRNQIISLHHAEKLNSFSPWNHSTWNWKLKANLCLVPQMQQKPRSMVSMQTSTQEVLNATLAATNPHTPSTAWNTECAAET